MQFSTNCIPSNVVDNIVYSDATNDLVLMAEDNVITCRQGGMDIRTLNTKEVHSFVKLVVASNKTEVYRNLVNNRFRLSHEDLLYLACQGGAGDMTQLIMERKVRPGFIIVMTLSCYCVVTICYCLRPSTLIM